MSGRNEAAKGGTSGTTWRPESMLRRSEADGRKGPTYAFTRSHLKPLTCAKEAAYPDRRAISRDAATRPIH